MPTESQEFPPGWNGLLLVDDVSVVEVDVKWQDSYLSVTTTINGLVYSNVHSITDKR